MDFNSINEHTIYTDVLREFCKNGHQIYAISPVEKRVHKPTCIIKENHATILKLVIGNIQKTNLLEKGLSTLTIENKFISGIKQYFSNIKFDLVLYPTPPITLVGVVDFIKKRDHAITYLMLKDIFPQNAIDMGILAKNGIKGPLYRYFRSKEKSLYDISDKIGCMSQANVDYVKKHNANIDSSKLEICPNSIEVKDFRLNSTEKKEMRKKYRLPLGKKIFVYGGNLGKPQGISFIIECLKTQLQNHDAFFLIIGNGTEFSKLETFFNQYHPENMRLMKSIPKEEYDRMIAACDVGMIFLDHRFTIPNFPSRLLSYMQAGIPVFACTDLNTDIGRVIEEGKFGWWCESNHIEDFGNIIQKINSKSLREMGENGFAFVKKHYSASQCYKQIMVHAGHT